MACEASANTVKTDRLAGVHCYASSSLGRGLPGEILDISVLSRIIVRTGDGCLLIRRYDVQDPSEIRVGAVFDSVDFVEQIKMIDKRYPTFVQESQKEITPGMFSTRAGEFDA